MFDTMLVPTWLQFSTKNRPKSRQTSIRRAKKVIGVAQLVEKATRGETAFQNEADPTFFSERILHKIFYKHSIV